MTPNHPTTTHALQSTEILMHTLTALFQYLCKLVTVGPTTRVHKPTHIHTATQCMSNVVPPHKTLHLHGWHIHTGSLHGAKEHGLSERSDCVGMLCRRSEPLLQMDRQWTQGQQWYMHYKMSPCGKHIKPLINQCIFCQSPCKKYLRFSSPQHMYLRTYIQYAQCPGPHSGVHKRLHANDTDVQV